MALQDGGAQCSASDDELRADDHSPQGEIIDEKLENLTKHKIFDIIGIQKMNQDLNQDTADHLDKANDGNSSRDSDDKLDDMLVIKSALWENAILKESNRGLTENVCMLKDKIICLETDNAFLQDRLRNQQFVLQEGTLKALKEALQSCFESEIKKLTDEIRVLHKKVYDNTQTLIKIDTCGKPVVLNSSVQQSTGSTKSVTAKQSEIGNTKSVTSKQSEAERPTHLLKAINVDKTIERYVLKESRVPVIDATSDDKIGPKRASATNISTSGCSPHNQDPKTRNSDTGTSVQESGTGKLAQQTVTLTQVSNAIATVEQCSAEAANGSSSESADACWTVVRRVHRGARDDPDGFNKTVRRGRGNPIRGSSENQSVLKGVPRMTSLHLTRLDPGTKAEDVQKFSSQLCRIIQCVQLTSKFPEAYSSFKLTVAYEDVDMLLNPDLWPKGALIQRFFHRRPSKQKAE